MVKKFDLVMVVVSFDRGSSLTLPFDLDEGTEQEIIKYWGRKQPHQYQKARRLYGSRELVEMAKKQIHGFCNDRFD